MDEKKIAAGLSELVTLMLEKGVPQADAILVWGANSDAIVSLYHKRATDQWRDTFASARGKNLSQAFTECREIIAALPSPEQARQSEFMAQLAKTIELGKNNGIDVDFVNPLVATMKRISKNALTDQRPLRAAE